MADLKQLRSRSGAVLDQGLRAARTPRARRIGWIVASVVLVFGVIAWFAVPMVVKGYAVKQMSAALKRPVSIGEVSFNPYTLRLRLDQLHIGESEGTQAFIDVDRLVVNASWSSLFRLAPVIDALKIEHLQIHIVRTAEQRFNFSDLLESKEAPPAKPGEPLRFAVYNIEIHDGSVAFDDQVLGAKHQIDKLQLGIPFVANLPAKTDVFVQPFLQLSLDGSPLNLTGRTKPFADSQESIIDLKLERFDLVPYLAYVPVSLPVKIPQGLLSTDLQLNFIQAKPNPTIKLSGSLSLDTLAINDRQDQPLLAFKRMEVVLDDVQPLLQIVHLGALRFDGLEAHFALNRDGSNNLEGLQNKSPTAPEPKNEAKAETKIAEPFDLAIESLELDNGALHYLDQRPATPTRFTVDALRLRANHLGTVGTTPAELDLGAQLAGGTFALKGTLDLAGKHANTDLSLDKIDLSALQPFVSPVLAAVIKSGSFAAQTKLEADFGGEVLGLKAAAASATINDFELRGANGRDVPLRWKILRIGLDRLDLAAAQAVLSEVHTEGLSIFVRRERDGSLNLAKLLRPAPPGPPAPAPKTNAPAWQAAVAAITLDGSSLLIEDATLAQPVKLGITPFDLHLQEVSSDLAKPLKLDFKGRLLHKGSLAIAGTLAPQPLAAQLSINAKQLDLAAFEPYIADQLNASIASARLSADGALKLATVGEQLRIGYRGKATLGTLRLLDKVSNEDFLSWNSLSATGLDIAIGEGPPKAHIGALALTDFYARIIVSADGKVNLQDVVAKPNTAPVSLTGAETGTVPVAPAPEPEAPAAETATAAQPLAADIALGRITLQGGRINYTDNFIKPNYSADVGDLAGTVGAFGTASVEPAEVVLQGKIDQSSPVDITGKINPLVPEAFVDIKAKADRIELTRLTPYTAHYAGYPIIKGTLSVDVQYLLDHGQLKADNHIFIDQLTFGDKVESPSATRLPVRLAVALLKNSRGEIDVRVPVSGSVSDPKFSLGGVIWRAFLNLIEKAVTSPFRLLASAFGGDQELGYVQFDPGVAVLTAESDQRIDSLAKALQDRPALRLDIVGRVDPEIDTPGLREAKVAERVRTQKIRDTVGKGESIDTSGVVVAPEEYAKYLERAYKAEKFTKPRNAIGLAKSLPPDEMKTLMVTNMVVSPEDLGHLAEARARIVQAQLAGKVDPARLFVVAPKLDKTGIEDKGKTTRVDFVLK